jgi:phosphate uptake regulator
MKRKLIQLGSATLVASLPAKWSKKFNLQRGSEVDVEEKEDKLIFSASKKAEVYKAEVNLSNIKRMYNYTLLSYYIKGVDELKVISDNPELISNLQTHPLPEFMGWEIIEQTKNSALIKDLAGNSEMDYESIFRRVFLLIKDMGSQMEDAIEKGDTQLKHVKAIDSNVNKFIFLIQRKLHKQGYTEFEKTAIMMHLAIKLESISDQYRDLGLFITEKKLKLGKKAILLFERVNKYFVDYSNLFFKYNRDTAASMDTEFRKLKEELVGYLEGIKSSAEIRAIIYIANIAEYTAEMLRNQLIISS